MDVIGLVPYLAVGVVIYLLLVPLLRRPPARVLLPAYALLWLVLAAKLWVGIQNVSILAG